MKSVVAKTSTVTSARERGTVTLPAGSLALDGRIRVSPDLAADIRITPQKGQIADALGGSGHSIEEVLQGRTVYVKLGALTGDPAKPWIKADLDKTSGVPGLSDLAKNANPLDGIRQLLAAGDLRRVGTEQVDGQKTEHYAGTVDVATLLKDPSVAKNLTSDQIQQIKASLDAAGVTKEHLDIWVAALPVEVKAAVDTAVGTVTTDIHLSDWNAPVTVTVPPADQVTDIAGLLPS